MLLIITGKRNSGKTKTAASLAAALKKQGVKTEGFYSPCQFINGEKNIYNVCSLISGETKNLLTRTPNGPVPNAEGFAFALNLLKNTGQAQVIIIDEVGPLEIKGLGFANALKQPDISKKTVITVRENLIDALLKILNCKEKPVILNLDFLSPEQAVAEALKCLL